MSEVVYNNLKNSLQEMYKKHETLLGYSTKAGIGLIGNIQIQISLLEDSIRETEGKVTAYEAENS